MCPSLFAYTKWAVLVHLVTLCVTLTWRFCHFFFSPFPFNYGTCRLRVRFIKVQHTFARRNKRDFIMRSLRSICASEPRCSRFNTHSFRLRAAGTSPGAGVSASRTTDCVTALFDVGVGSVEEIFSLPAPQLQKNCGDVVGSVFRKELKNARVGNQDFSEVLWMATTRGELLSDIRKLFRHAGVEEAYADPNVTTHPSGVPIGIRDEHNGWYSQQPHYSPPVFPSTAAVSPRSPWAAGMDVFSYAFAYGFWQQRRESLQLAHHQMQKLSSDIQYVKEALDGDHRNRLRLSLRLWCMFLFPFSLLVLLLLSTDQILYVAELKRVGLCDYDAWQRRYPRGR
ncbi:hypothetical protein, conserved [Trypanosoma brucei brucei TREU927]|uniref:Transmembrane protein n=1 Tax=Trypanosoma brucei brucei (strain 927/4 GUTat10.1) TaxID=185431 RepID=Q38BR8_TRYB2|nr:hypothetical protein, conserved [Trypanosoma brucei brucei TREU927]EAN77752.1 hypothetical protein, conserved [Trypanosoma brucei brucei TREU927]